MRGQWGRSFAGKRKSRSRVIEVCVGVCVAGAVMRGCCVFVCSHC